MTTLNCYLSFNGNCEAAFNFYKSVFGGEFTCINRYKDMPSEQPIPDSEKEKVLHMGLVINPNAVLMGADSSEILGCKATFGDNISISINADSEDEAKRIFNALSADGNVTCPLEKAFWGALFGMFVDKFGINWLVSYDYNSECK